MEQTIKHLSVTPLDPNVLMYSRWEGNVDVYSPWTYTGWVDETLSWKKTCYISHHLSGMMACLKVKGPDAERLMSETYVNNFSLEKFPVGRAKHTIAVSSRGYVSIHGMTLRVAEDEFDTYSLDPNTPAQVFSGKYDVEQIEPVYYNDFVFQIAGPRSLEVVENALEQDIHDLPFMAFQPGVVASKKVRVLRMGMGGTLAYELHGAAEDGPAVYAKVMEVGKAYGIRRLGMLAYMCNHTENGFPQCGTHFDLDFTGTGVEEYLGQGGAAAGEMTGEELAPLHGSMADMGRDAYLANPFELGWGKSIYWGHDFIGKEALLKLRDDPHTRRICTLEWSGEDLGKVFAGYFDDDPKLPDPLVFPKDYYFESAGNLSDKVLDGQGNLVGRSTGFLYTAYYKRVISLGMIDPDLCHEGQELKVLWGTPGTRQFEVRVKVARYPYLDLTANRDMDLETIPHYQG